MADVEGFAKKGEKIHLELACIWTIRDGQIAEYHDYAGTGGGAGHFVKQSNRKPTDFLSLHFARAYALPLSPFAHSPAATVAGRVNMG